MREAFMEKFLVHPKTRCWVWTAARGVFGHGQIYVGGKRTENAHRVSYRLHVGPIPEGMYVCHKCDNPPCVNPEHLYIGTARDNARDMVQRGRMPTRKGAKNGRAKLTADQVLEIKKALAGPNYRGRQSRLAEKYKVGTSMISFIATGQNWTHVQ